MLSNVRRQRVDCLGELLAAMRVLRLRMLNSLEPIGILLRKSDSRLFCALGNDLWDGGGLHEAWQNMRSNECSRGGNLFSLHEDDLRIMDVFFQNLGKSGRDEQSELFASVIADMEEAQSCAKIRYADASKLYTALGTLVGIGLCILIV